MAFVTKPDDGHHCLISQRVGYMDDPLTDDFMWTYPVNTMSQEVDLKQGLCIDKKILKKALLPIGVGAPFCRLWLSEGIWRPVKVE